MPWQPLDRGWCEFIRSWAKNWDWLARFRWPLTYSVWCWRISSRQVRIFQTICNMHIAVKHCERWRLDALHVKCITKNLRIAPPYFSRISNDDVSAAAKCTYLTTDMKRQQLKLFGSIAMMPRSYPIRRQVHDESEQFRRADTEYSKGGRKPDFAGLMITTWLQLQYVAHLVLVHTFTQSSDSLAPWISLIHSCFLTSSTNWQLAVPRIFRLTSDGSTPYASSLNV